MKPFNNVRNASAAQWSCNSALKTGPGSMNKHPVDPISSLPLPEEVACDRRLTLNQEFDAPRRPPSRSPGGSDFLEDRLSRSMAGLASARRPRITETRSLVGEIPIWLWRGGRLFEGPPPTWRFSQGSGSGESLAEQLG